MTRYVMVHNGQEVPCGQPSGAWLTQDAPRGAYTTARTVQGHSVLKLSSHVRRLAESANLMAAADAVKAGAPMPPLLTAEELHPQVVNAMAVAVRRFQQLPPDGQAAATAAAAASAAAAAAATAAAAGSISSNSGAAGDWRAQEVKLTLLLTWEPRRAGHDLWCHAQRLPPRVAPPIRIQINGSARANARAKDSEWVRQRAALEAGRPPGVEEVVLQGEGGELMEGLSSNFFVLQGGCMVTADEGVLSGTIRELVLQVCAERGVPVQLRPPLLGEAGSWQAAFISSTSRLLLPVDEVLLPAAVAAGGAAAPEVLSLRDKPPVARELEAAVMAKILECSERIL